MKNTFFSLLILILTSCKTETKINESDPIKDKIDELANRYFELNRFSGTILVIKKDSIIYDSHFGLADYEDSKSFSDKTAFKIGAISELITQDFIEKLATDRKIELSDKISKYIPELETKYTINDFLNHNTNFPSIENIAKKYPELTYDTIEFANIVNDSISETEKSNLNYNLLGLLIETVSGKNFQKNIEDYSEKLELKNTYYLKSNYETALGYQYHNYRNKGLELQKTQEHNLNTAFSSNGLKSTTKDLFKIIKQSSNKTISINGYTANDGFSYSIENDKENETCIIVLSNFRQPIAKEISNSISSILDNHIYRLPLARQPFDVDKKALADYTGYFSLNEYVKFEVIKRNDSLFVILGPNETYLIPQSSNQFYLQDRDGAMRFLKDSSNVINRVELLDGFLNGQIANRIKEEVIFSF